jgi:hypothetical protein
MPYKQDLVSVLGHHQSHFPHETREIIDLASVESLEASVNLLSRASQTLTESTVVWAVASIGNADPTHSQIRRRVAQQAEVCLSNAPQ